jgi:hypothetical protein
MSFRASESAMREMLQGLVAPPGAMPAAVRPRQTGSNQGIAQVAAVRQSHIGINPLPVLVWLDS